MPTQPIWLPINGFENFYEVSSSGFVRSIGKGNWRRKNGVLNGSEDSMGYPHVILHANGKKLTSTVHRLVAKAFIPNPDNLPHVNHKNCIKTDNRVENLEWCTAKENIAHSYANNRQPIKRGENTWNCKLNESAVIELRRRYAAGGVRYKDLAAEYGVSPSVIGFAVVRKTWKHVP